MISFARLGVWLALVVVGWASLSSGAAQTVVVGGKNFTEQLLVAEMTSQLLAAHGFSVQTKTGFTTLGTRKEQEAGLLDVYWEYTGTSLLTFNNVREALDPEQAYRRVAELDAHKGLIWLTPSKVNNTYALAMRRADAVASGITSISELARRVRGGETIRFLSNTEFFTRPDGLLPLQRAYQFAFEPKDVVRMDTNAIYDTLRSGSSAEVGLVFSTDGRVAAYDFVLLEDDRAFFPSYLLTPVVRRPILDQHPELAAHLNSISSKLDNDTIAKLNAMVDLQQKPVEEVAASFLKAHGLAAKAVN
jgi:osmoprotectant transport system substrate-binding protein